MIVTFQVHGTPRPAGSHTAGRRKDGSPFVRHANPNTADWIKAIREAARRAMGHETKPRPPFTSPVKVIAYFYLPRPKSHFNSKGELHYWAPLFHGVKSDLDKYQRAAGDGLVPYVLKDDALISWWEAKKIYCPVGQEPHISLEVRELS